MLVQPSKELNDIKAKAAACEKTINNEVAYLEDILKKLKSNYNTANLKKEVANLTKAISASIKTQVEADAKKIK